MVHGILGRMGQEVTRALCSDPELEVVGAVEREVGEDHLLLPQGDTGVPFSSDVEYILDCCKPEVLVDFTVAEATRSVVPVAARHRVNLVIGTTGLTASDISDIDRLAKVNGVGVVIAPNFALGAVIMTHLAEVAAKFFDWAEIIEMHHEQKLDAPSGTALATAKAMLHSRGKPFFNSGEQKEMLSGARGGQMEGIAIHSVRLPGLLAHQQVILGAAGQTLTIRHDAISRECYIPGVLLAIKKVIKLNGLVYGLDALLGL